LKCGASVPFVLDLVLVLAGRAIIFEDDDEDDEE